MANRMGNESRGNVIYDESIVSGIIAIAVSSVEGVVVQSGKKGKISAKEYIKTVSEKGGISVEVTIAVLSGYNIPDVAYNIQYGIKANVEAMTKYKISKVDVNVTDVVYDLKSAQN